MKAAIWIIRFRGTSDDSLPLAILERECNKYSDLSHAVKAGAERIGLPVGDYSTHSLRSCGATYLSASGVETEVIMALGRWK
jgi:hypothetical protein